MESLRKWFYKPKKDDRSLLAQFFFADEALNMVAAELDSFDGRKDPDRCTTLVNQLRHAQDRVLNITSKIMDQVLGDERVARGFRVKFPEDVLLDNLAGQLWFGAECLAAGSCIMNREEESAAMRPLAKALTRSLETVRSLLREQCLRPRGMALTQHDDMLQESLKIFDRLFAEFELCYVSAMVNVKTPQEFETQELICVLFSETVSRALKIGLLTQEQVDSYDPALMFAIPRLAIVTGLLIYSSGPLSIDKPPDEMSDMFRPFRTLLHKIRSLLWTLDRRELSTLERLLCTNEDVSTITAVGADNAGNLEDGSSHYPDIGDFATRFYSDHKMCRDLYEQINSTNESVITESDYLPDNVEVLTPILEGIRRLESIDNGPPHSTYRQNSTDSTDTFQSDDRSRKTSRAESDISALRNLSTNGLMMFDPLLINAISTGETSTRQMPDQNLVTSLNEQVTEIADKLTSIATNDNEGVGQDLNQIHSFSTNDVPMLIATDTDGFHNNVTFPSPRSDLPNMPSTSHGYLIPNAISQEPVVLSALSHNNSAIFNENDETVNQMNNTILAAGHPLIIPDDIDESVMNTSISIANANLSSLLLTNDEITTFQEETTELDDASFKTANMTYHDDSAKVKFMVGYDSDTQETPGDSGVSTENTSLDRSPDYEHNKEIKVPNFEEEVSSDSAIDNNVSERNNVDTESFITQNVLDNSDRHEKDFTNDNIIGVTEIVSGDVTVNINYVDSSNQSKNEAGPSASLNVNKNVNISNKNNDMNTITECENTEEYSNLEDVLKENERLLQTKKEELKDSKATSSKEVEDRDRRRKSKKTSSSKSKRKTHMWKPGRVILDNRAHQNQNVPMMLNLDHLVDESGPSYLSECADDEQIALALQAQELVARQQARAKFRSSEDLIHRLFVCIAGVADQLQTNFAADLRNILKSVFLMNQTPEITPEPEPIDETKQEIEYAVTDEQVIQNGVTRQNGGSFDSVYSAEEVYADTSSDSANSDIGTANDANASTSVPRENEIKTDINELEDTVNQPSVNQSEAIVNQFNVNVSHTEDSVNLVDNVNCDVYEDDRAEYGRIDYEGRKSLEIGNLQGSVSTGDLTEYRRPGEESDRVVVERAPEWIPDIQAPDCMRCKAHFTAFRRRHHCRNCGKVFCASCSSNSIPLPRFGQMKPVRVCEECFRGIAKNCRQRIQPQSQRYRI